MKLYAVAKGRTTGIFNNWSECEDSVKGFRDAKFKKFGNYQDAEKYIKKMQSDKNSNKSIRLEIVESVMSQFFYNGMSEEEACEFVCLAFEELKEQLEGIEG